jgi:hypothetical protein
VGLAVFGAGATFEKHAGSLPRARVGPARGWVGPQGGAGETAENQGNWRGEAAKNVKNRSPVRKSG